MRQEGKTVLVLGGGVGGLVAAHEVRTQLPRPHRVVPVERSTTHLFYPSWLWLILPAAFIGISVARKHVHECGRTHGRAFSDLRNSRDALRATATSGTD